MIIPDKIRIGGQDVNIIQEDKKLLLKDLCARLPYGVIVATPKGRGYVCDINLTIFDYELGVNINPIIRDTFSINDVKPYLLPMSSMTEEQKKEYNNLQCYVPIYYYEYKELVEEIELHPTLESFEYLYKNHFDYRGLITMGLAIDATGLYIY